MDAVIAYLSNPATAWALAGAAFILIEVTLITAMGFLFAGLGALTLSGLFAYGFLAADLTIPVQVAIFFGLTILWAAFLWVPLKRWMRERESEGYTDMIGQRAEVEGGKPLTKGEPGKVRWSGAQMIALLPTDCPRDKVLVGEQVFIIGKKGNALFVSPASIPMPDEETLKAYRKKDKFN